MKNLSNILRGGGAIALFLLLFSASSSYAQCPDDTYGIAPSVTLYPWASGSTTQLIPGTTCSITIYYCRRNIADGSEQVWVYMVVPQSSDCDPISPTDLIHWGQRLVFNANDVNGLVPCIKGHKVVHVFQAACWNLGGTSPTGMPEFMVCFGAAKWCELTCDVCVDLAGTVFKSNCTGSQYYSAPCGVSPPISWEMGQCYTLGCYEP
jgi:hypothetical protein